MTLNGRIEAKPQAGVAGVQEFKQPLDKPQAKVNVPLNYQLTLDASKTLHSIVRRENALRQMLSNLPAPVAAAVNRIIMPIATATLKQGMGSVIAALLQSVSQLRELAVELEQAKTLLKQQTAVQDAAVSKTLTTPDLPQAGAEGKSKQPAPSESQGHMNQTEQPRTAQLAAAQREALLKWQALSLNELRHSKQALDKYVDFLRQHTQGQSNHDEGTAALSLVLPQLTAAQEVRTVYIHIYHETADERPGYGKKRQTWLRVLCETDSLGIVEAYFHYWAPDQVDVRLIFTAEIYPVAVAELTAQVRQIFAHIPTLNLTKLDVVTPAKQGVITSER